MVSTIVWYSIYTPCTLHHLLMFVQAIEIHNTALLKMYVYSNSKLQQV